MTRRFLAGLLLGIAVGMAATWIAATAHRVHPRITFYGHARTFSATAYCAGAITASGRRPRYGHVALTGGDPWYTWGTRLFVTRVDGSRHRTPFADGRRFFVVEDRIGAHSQLDFFNPWGGEPDCGFGRHAIRARRYRWVRR